MNVFQKVTQLLPEAEYWWIGSGALDKQLKEYVKKLGLEDKVKFFGSRKDTPDLYHAMDVFFMPSLFEGLPLTCLEAQGAGLPVIVSDAVTKEMEYTDLIEFVSLNDSLEVWAKQLEQAAKMETNRPENRLKYADELKKSVFSDANCGNVLTGVYEKFLNDNKRL